MFISDEEVASRLQAPTNLVNRPPLRRVTTDTLARKEERYEKPLECEVVGDEDQTDSTTIAPLHNGGRRGGDKNISPEMRTLIGTVAQFDTLKNVAKNLNVSLHHAHELKHGKHSNAQGQNEELVSKINGNLAKPHDSAVDKLARVLDNLTNEKISAIDKPKDILSAATQLARIAEMTSPIKKDDDEDGDRGPRLIIYSPTIKSEHHYDSKEVPRAQN